MVLKLLWESNMDAKSSYLVLWLHRLQLGVVLAHFLHKSFLQAQHFVQLDQFLGELGLPQCMTGCKGLRGVLPNNAGDILLSVLQIENILFAFGSQSSKKIRAEVKECIFVYAIKEIWDCIRVDLIKNITERRNILTYCRRFICPIFTAIPRDISSILSCSHGINGGSDACTLILWKPTNSKQWNSVLWTCCHLVDYNVWWLVYLELQDDVLQVLHHLDILLQLLVLQSLQQLLKIHCTSDIKVNKEHGFIMWQW